MIKELRGITHIAPKPFCPYFILFPDSVFPLSLKISFPYIRLYGNNTTVTIKETNSLVIPSTNPRTIMIVIEYRFTFDVSYTIIGFHFKEPICNSLDAIIKMPKYNGYIHFSRKDKLCLSILNKHVIYAAIAQDSQFQL